MDTPKQTSFAVPQLKQIASAAFAKAVSNLETPEDYINLVDQLLTFPPAYLHRVIPEMPWSGIRCLFQSGKFDEYLTSATMDTAVLQEENQLRQKFAKNPNHKNIQSPTAGLIDVFGVSPFNPDATNSEMFTLRSWGMDFFSSSTRMSPKPKEQQQQGEDEMVEGEQQEQKEQTEQPESSTVTTVGTILCEQTEGEQKEGTQKQFRRFFLTSTNRG